MGLCTSSHLNYDLSSKASAEIDKLSSKARRTEEGTIKFLLLGAGESGKSTLFKQLNNIYGNGYTHMDREKYVPVLHNNLLTSMRTLIEQARARTHVVFGGETLSTEIPAPYDAECDQFLEHSVDAIVTPEIAAMVTRLWKLEGIRNVLKVRSSYQLPDSAEYFFKRAEAYGSEDFLPSDEDMLSGRSMTTGIIDKTLEIPPNVFRIVDVGGQR